MKTARSLALQAACGAAAGFVIAAVLAAIAIPKYSTIPLPVELIPQAEKLSRLAHDLAALNGLPLGLIGLGVIFASWGLTVRMLNPALPPFPYFSAPKAGAAWAAVILSWLSAWEPQAGLPMSSGVLNSPGDGGSNFFLALLPSVLGGAISWLIISREGWAGAFDRWRAPWAAAKRSWIRTAALGAAYGAVLGAGGQTVGKLFGFLFLLNVEVWNPGDFLSVGQCAINFAVPMLLLACAFPAAWSLAFALADDDSSVALRVRRAAPGLCIAAAVGLTGFGLRRNAATEHDWNAGTLAAAASLPDAAAAPLTVVSLGFDHTPQVAAKPWGTAARYSSLSTSGEIAATEANAQALLQFLNGRGIGSRFRNASIEALDRTYSALWEPDKAFAAFESLGPRYEVPFIYGMLERAWLANSAPVTAQNLARLEGLSDENRYRIPGRAALTLARAWRRFGDLDKTRDWLEKARKGGAETAALEKFAVPAKPLLTDGVVSGRAAAPGGRAHAVQVGLFAIGDDATETSAMANPNMILVWLVSSQWAGRDGSFKFEHLAQGRYALALLVSAEAVAPGAPIKAANHPGIIAIDRARPRFDAGTITLTVR